MADNTGKSRLVIRITVFLLLAIVLALGLMDYRAKSKATKTANAWLGLIEDGMWESELEQYVVGNPEIAMYEDGGGLIRSYTWEGVFRNYRIEVAMAAHGRPGNHPVWRINGPIND